jgi:glycosyltransferase 2 family protein
MKYKGLISFCVAVIIFGGLFQLVDWASVIETFTGANLLLVLLAICLTIFWPFIGAMRWQRVLSALGHRVGFLSALNAVMIAFSANLFAPAKSGDLVKVLVMGDIASKKSLTAAVLAERIGDLLVLGLFAVVSGLILGINWSTGIGACLILGVAIAIIFSSRSSLKFKRIWLQNTWDILQAASRIWIDKYFQMAVVVFWSFVNWGLAGLQVWLFFIALGVEISLLTVLALFPIAVLVSLIPITPGSIGVRESAFLFVFLPYAEPHVSIAASLGYFICNTGMTALIGAGFLHLHIYKDKPNSLINIK